MIIRNARTGEEQSIANVIINTWRAAYRGIIPDRFLDALTTGKHEALFKENIKSAPENIFVLENHEQQIVGMVFGGSDRSGAFDCELVAIYILPDYQKRGYGKKLFKALIERYKKQTYKSMLIWTFKDNKDQEFYKKLGGVVSKEMSYTFGEKNVPLVGYTWDNINDIAF